MSATNEGTASRKLLGMIGTWVAKVANAAHACAAVSGRDDSTSPTKSAQVNGNGGGSGGSLCSPILWGRRAGERLVSCRRGNPRVPGWHPTYPPLWKPGDARRAAEAPAQGSQLARQRPARVRTAAACGTSARASGG
jgi:hypothetical protein